MNEQIEIEINRIAAEIPLSQPRQAELLKTSFMRDNNLLMLGGRLIAVDASGVPTNQDVKHLLTSYANENGMLTSEAAEGIKEGSELETLKGKSFGNAMQQAGIRQNTDASDQLFLKWRKANPGL